MLFLTQNGCMEHTFERKLRKLFLFLVLHISFKWILDKTEKKKIIFPEFLKEIDKNNKLGVGENHKVILFYNLRYIESWSLEDPVE